MFPQNLTLIPITKKLPDVDFERCIKYLNYYSPHILREMNHIISAEYAMKRI